MRKRNVEKSVEARWCYLFLVSPVIGFILLHVYPISWTFKWAFYSFDGTPQTAKWIGLQNFINFFTRDFTYWKAWLNTIQFALMKVPLEMAMALGLAMHLSNGRKCAGLFRSLYYMPAVISVAIIGIVFSNLFSYFGVVNVALTKLGVIEEGINWFSTKGNAMAVLVFGSIWNTFGINVMYFMAALSNVPLDLYESAELDGANAWRKFISITLPTIVPIFQIILLMSIVGTLSTNDYIIAMTGGAPAGETHTIMSYMTKNFVPGFADNNVLPLGYGCSMSVVTTILFVIIGLVYNRVNKKLQG